MGTGGRSQVQQHKQGSQNALEVLRFKFLTQDNSVDLKIDLIVYLRASPEVSFARTLNRGREEERDISQSDISKLHDLHEQWLIHELYPVPAPVYVVDADQSEEEMDKVCRRMLQMFRIVQSAGD